jgi:tripartite ATP-independent transporter DctM subunit
VDPVLLGVIGFVALVVFIGLGVPVGVSLLIPGLGGLFYFVGAQGTFEIFTSQAFRYATNFDFTALPMFLLMGYIVMEAGLASSAYDAARLWLSRLPGGLGMASCVASGLFGACCGSGVAATAAMGRIAIPEMIRHNYNKSIAAGTVTAATTVAVLIPPSMILVMYSVFTEVSLGRLLLAGYIPGVLSIGIYMLMIYVRVRINPDMAPSVSESITWRQRIAALKDVWGIIVLAVVLFGGIYTGFFTATEAAAVCAFTAFILLFITGNFRWKVVRNAFSETLRIAAMAFILMLGAIVFVVFINLSGLPEALTAFIVGANMPIYLFLIVVGLMYVALGCFMPSLSLLLVTMPILLPVLIDLNVNLIWFGIIWVKLVELGAITPPFGVAVYVIGAITGDEIPIEDIFRGLGWFVLMDVITIAILMAFPQITLWVPSLMKGA